LGEDGGGDSCLMGDGGGGDFFGGGGRGSGLHDGGGIKPGEQASGAVGWVGYTVAGDCG
jgi:hypothetical protein